MTTTPGAAGTAAYNPAISSLITHAFRDMGVIDENETPSAAMMSDAFDVSQLMLKEWEGMGIHVWTEEEGILFLQAGQNRYLLGDPGGNFTPANACDAYAYVQTNQAQPAAQGATVLPLLSIAGLSSGMNIGVALDNGSTFWTTINGAPAQGAVTLASALPGPAMGGANNVFAYAQANAITRPLKVPFVRRLTWAPAGAINGPSEIPIWVMARKDYQALPNKQTPGLVTEVFYAPKQGFGELLCWNTPADASSALRFTWLRPISDLATVASTVDVPQEWCNAIRWNLAKELSPSYEVPPQKWDRIVMMAAQKLDMAQSWDRESEAVQFGFDCDGRG
jgi:hypothetical protein